MTSLRQRAAVARVRRVAGRRVRPALSLRDRSEAACLLQVTAVATCVPLVMHLPLTTMSRLMTWRARRGSSLGLAPERLAEIVAIAQVSARPLVQTGCVTRTMCLFWFLGPGDDELRMCFGIGGEAVGFAGHCWLERCGEPFLERVDPRRSFAEQLSVPASRHR